MFKHGGRRVKVIADGGTGDDLPSPFSAAAVYGWRRIYTCCRGRAVA